MSNLSVELVFVAGPRAGERLPLSAGTHVIGREPGPGGIALSDDQTVSRAHARLIVAADGVTFENISANGSKVDGQFVKGSLRLAGGEEFVIGGHHRMAVRIEGAFSILAPQAEAAASPPPAAAPPASTSAPLARSKKASRDRLPQRRAAAVPVPVSEDEEEEQSLLQKPWVRAMLGIYLVGFLVAAVVLGGEKVTSVRRPTLPWSTTQAQYEIFAENHQLTVEVKERRLARAREVYQRMGVFWERREVLAYRQSCSELMTIDGDPDSPFFKFAAYAIGQKLPR